MGAGGRLPRSGWLDGEGRALGRPGRRAAVVFPAAQQVEHWLSGKKNAAGAWLRRVGPAVPDGLPAGKAPRQIVVAQRERVHGRGHSGHAAGRVVATADDEQLRAVDTGAVRVHSLRQLAQVMIEAIPVAVQTGVVVRRIVRVDEAIERRTVHDPSVDTRITPANPRRAIQLEEIPGVQVVHW